MRPHVFDAILDLDDRTITYGGKRMVNTRNLVALAFKGVAMAMAAVAIALTAINVGTFDLYVILLAIGLFSMAIASIMEAR